MSGPGGSSRSPRDAAPPALPPSGDAGSLRDVTGAALDLRRPPRRIVSLIPSTTETLCALGLADALVGITSYCREPREALLGKTRIGGEKDPDLEAIRALEPDLVIANVEENVRAHVETLRAWGIAVWVVYPRTVAGGIEMVRELGRVTGTERRAERVAGELDARYAEVCAGSAGRTATPVFYAIWREPWMTIGGDTYIHDMLRVCGGANVFADHADRYPTVTLAEVAARRPALILLPDEPYRFRRAHVKDFAPYADVPAVRDGRIRLVDGKPFSWHGPRIADALRTIPALLRAQAE
jgi:ABC-type Fe3+-hydroxamate transport system substrate-binding protein